MNEQRPKSPSLASALRTWRRAREQFKIDTEFDPPRLTRDELVARLTLNSPAVVDEVHSIALRLLENDEARSSKLDSKAHALLGTAGLSLTAASAFAPVLQAHMPTWSMVVYGLALLLGLLATVKAAHATRVTPLHRGLNEREMLDPEALRRADTFALSDSDGDDMNATEKGYGNVEERRRCAYRRYVTVQYWRIWQQHFGIHQLKAKQIKRGQTYFLGFLMSLIAVGAMMGYDAYTKPSKPLGVESAGPQTK